MRATRWMIVLCACVAACGGAAAREEPAPSSSSSGDEPRAAERAPDPEPEARAEAVPPPLEPAATCAEDMLPVALSSLQRISRSPYLVLDAAALVAVSPDAVSPGHVLGTAGPLLTITADAVLLDGAPVAGADDAARARAIATAWRAADRRRPRPEALYVAAPGDTRLDRLEVLVGALPRVQLLARAAPREEPALAQSPWTREALARVEAAPDRAARCDAVRAELDRAIAGCEAARAPVRALLDATPTCTPGAATGSGLDRSAAVTDALAACDCAGADIVAILALYARAADRVEQAIRGFPLEGPMWPGEGGGLEGLEEGAGPSTVLERVRSLERQRSMRGY